MTILPVVQGSVTLQASIKRPIFWKNSNIFLPSFCRFSQLFLFFSFYKPREPASRYRGQDSSQNQFSGSNSGKIQGVRSDAMLKASWATNNTEDCLNSLRPKGSQKMDDFFVAPPQCSVKLQFRRRVLKSSHFLASKADSGSNPAPLTNERRVRREIFARKGKLLLSFD